MNVRVALTHIKKNQNLYSPVTPTKISQAENPGLCITTLSTEHFYMVSLICEKKG